MHEITQFTCRKQIYQFILSDARKMQYFYKTEYSQFKYNIFTSDLEDVFKEIWG